MSAPGLQQRKLVGIFLHFPTSYPEARGFLSLAQTKRDFLEEVLSDFPPNLLSFGKNVFFIIINVVYSP
jgi:hypothetical protein